MVKVFSLNSVTFEWTRPVRRGYPGSSLATNFGEKFITQKEESVVTFVALTLQVFMYDAKQD